MRIKLFWIGKTRDESIRNLTGEYLRRVAHFTSCEVIEIRDLTRGRKLGGADAARAEGREIIRRLPPGARVAALDEGGRQISSEQFSRRLEEEQVRGTREIAFVIGGPEGLSPEVRARADWILSLGKMTWTHEMCRVLLLEQIYRAFCIARNLPYHK